MKRERERKCDTHINDKNDIVVREYPCAKRKYDFFSYLSNEEWKKEERRFKKDGI